MVLKRNLLFLNKKSRFLNFFFFLWERKSWTGGRSFGRKVFRGQVGNVSGRRFSYWIIWDYSLLNIKGFIQSFFKPFNVNCILNFIFFKKYGFLSLLPSEETTTVSSVYLNSIFDTETNFGNSNLLKNFTVGSLLFLIQTKKNTHAKVSWSAGTYCKLIKKTGDRAFVQFPSTVVGIIPTNTFATKGMSKKLIIKKITKAGDSKLLGRIPKVRGIAMNPVDHPHGGRTNGGCHPRTPTGFLTKNVKTRKKKWWSNSIIFSLRK